MSTFWIIVFIISVVIALLVTTRFVYLKETFSLKHESKADRLFRKVAFLCYLVPFAVLISGVVMSAITGHMPPNASLLVSLLTALYACCMGLCILLVGAVARKSIQ
ncbi:hypothetical protein FWF48_02165 [Candidatus Saccharibacteria bacterium]|nr:hypothetical protein [Candidatus Saccharibacteria bacterium]